MIDVRLIPIIRICLFIAEFMEYGPYKDYYTVFNEQLSLLSSIVIFPSPKTVDEFLSKLKIILLISDYIEYNSSDFSYTLDIKELEWTMDAKWRGKYQILKNLTFHKTDYTDYEFITYNNNIYFVGGKVSDVIVNKVYKYSKGILSQVAPMHYARRYPLIINYRGYIFAIGGGGSPKTAEYYNPGNNTWTVTENLVFNRHRHFSTAVIFNDSIFVFCDANNTLKQHASENIESFNFITNKWVSHGTIQRFLSDFPMKTSNKRIEFNFIPCQDHLAVIGGAYITMSNYWYTNCPVVDRFYPSKEGKERWIFDTQPYQPGITNCIPIREE
jgi:hypothetical protein